MSYTAEPKQQDTNIGNVWGRKLALSAPAPGYKETEVCL